MRIPPAPDTSGLPPPSPVVPLSACPINATLGTLGRKWTLTILRDIAFYPGARFSAILRTNPGIRSRTLSLRLRQLVRDGLIVRVPDPGRRRKVGYELTAKGREVWPVLAALAQFGVRHHAELVFPDASPRNLEDVFPHDATLMLGPIVGFARLAEPGPPRLRKASRAATGGSVVRDGRALESDRGTRS